MFPPLNISKAKEYCLKLQADFDKYGVETVVYGATGAGEISTDGGAAGSDTKSGEFSQFSAESNVRQCAAHSSVYAKKPERPDGQMFGILVCADCNGNEVVLKAFSGQFRSVWNIPGWAPPLLSENEFARLTEKTDEEIHELTAQIESLEKQITSRSSMSCGGQMEPDDTVELLEKLSGLKEKRRNASKKSMHGIFALYKIPFLARLETAETFSWLHPRNGKIYPRYKLRPIIKYRDVFSFYCGRETDGGTSNGKMPPTGAGECCAPKLIAQAHSLGLRPVSLAEFYYGENSLSGEKQHKQFYEPCNEKCAPLLPEMLGLKIIYQDEAFVVVEKPSGLLSVTGRGAEKQDCVVNRVKFLFGGKIGWCDMYENECEPDDAIHIPDSSSTIESPQKYPHCIEQPAVHRLDMETSGLIAVALTKEAHSNLRCQFEAGTVKKQYVAVLDGIPQCIKNGVTDGRLELPFRLDVEHRPLQIYDEVNGKLGITEWKFLRYEKGGRTRLLFTPLTGRTHQLRLHSADPHGLGVPIVGDTLYGNGTDTAKKTGTDTESAGVCHFQPTSRLLLHACMLEITHPITGQRMKFESTAPF